MRRFTIISVVVFGLFIGINTVSFFVLSDGHGVQTVEDGFQRAGYPLLFWERGGYVYRQAFSLVAFATDFLVAAGAGILVTLLYGKLKHSR